LKADEKATNARVKKNLTFFYILKIAIPWQIWLPSKL
jgi:hypothetical protein